MELETRTIQLSTRGHTHIVNITDQVQTQITEAGFVEGSALVACIGSTGGISTVEYEPGLVGTDISEALGKVAPYDIAYEHNNTWGDDNGAAHIRSTLVGTSYTVPFNQGKLMLGTWQQIVFLDFDTRARNRSVVVQIWGKKK